MSTPTAAYITTDNEIPDPIEEHLDVYLTAYAPDNQDAVSEEVVLVEYQTLQTSNSEDTKLIGQYVNQGKFLLIIPPLEAEASVTLTESTDITIDTETTDTHIRVSPELADESEFKTFSVETVGSFSVVFGQVLATDSNESPVCTLWQPSSISGGAVLTTVSLTELAITANEQDRRTLLKLLVDYLQTLDSQAPEHREKTESTAESTAEVPTKTLDRVLIGLYLQHHSEDVVSPSQSSINNELPPQFQVQLSNQEWSSVLDTLESLGIWTNSRIMGDQLDQIIADRNLASFIRRLENA